MNKFTVIASLVDLIILPFVYTYTAAMSMQHILFCLYFSLDSSAEEGEVGLQVRNVFFTTQSRQSRTGRV